MGKKPKWKFPVISKRSLISGAAIVLLSALAGSFTANVYLAEEIKKLKQSVTTYEQSQVELQNKVGYLVELNEKAIIPLQEKVGDLEGKLGSKGVLGPVARAVGGINLFNKDTPVFGQSELEKLIKTVEGQSTNPDEIFADYQVKTHGIKLYEQKIPGFGSLRIGDEEKMAVQQDMGDNVYIMVLNPGTHNGIDVSNVNLKDVASTRVYTNFKAKVLEDYIHPTKGRTIFLQAVDLKDENGNSLGVDASHFAGYNVFPKYESGKIIEKDGFVGYLGYTGFMSGLHLHEEFYKSPNGKPWTWKLFDAYNNKTYKQNIVWFSVNTIPDEVREVVRQAVK